MNANDVIEVRVDDVRIGDRFRRDMGDVESLACSIEEIGLLQPIGITPDKRLIFGQRRQKLKVVNGGAA